VSKKEKETDKLSRTEESPNKVLLEEDKGERRRTSASRFRQKEGWQSGSPLPR